MDELWLNGLKVEKPQKAVSLNLQINDLGELKDRQSDFTDRFKLELTPRNISIMEYLGIVGNQSTVPYRNISAKWVVDGVELISEGRAIVKSVIEKNELKQYDVHIYNNNIDFFNAIEGKSIRELDWSDINHKASYIDMIQSLNGTKDYIYAIAGYAGKIPVQNNFDLKYMLPSVFFHAIWRRIWSEAGFTYTGEVFSDDDFIGTIMGATSFDKGQTNFLQKDFASILPDIDQKQFVKEVIWRYGLMFRKIRNESEYEFKYIKDVLVDKENSVDYSDNFVSKKKGSFRLGKYAKKNWLRYNESNDGTTNQDGSIDVSIENLGGSKDIMKSVFNANVNITPFNYFEVPVFEIDTENDSINITEQKPWIAKIEFIQDSNSFLDEDGEFRVYSGDKPFAKFTNLSFRRQIYFNYREIREVISKAKVFEVLMKFNPEEIYQFNFLKLLYIKQLGSYFYANKIKGYKPDTVSTVELVKIPPSVFEIREDTTPPIVNLEVDDTNPTVGATSVFTLTVTEENIDNWTLDFGYAGESISGIDQPPTNITHIYPVGSYTATLTVTDFEGNQGSDSVNITIQDVDDLQINNSTGEITAPGGTTIEFMLSVSGSGTLSGFSGVSPTLGGSNTLASGQVDNDPVNSSFDQTYQSSFVMPGNGQAFLTGSCSPIGGGSTGGALVIQLKLINETETAVVNLNETYP